MPEVLGEHLTTTVDGLWVVWAYKLARPVGDLFVPMTGGSGYPADARAECRSRGNHGAPDPNCTCGFHALSVRRFPNLPPRHSFTALTVALSGRILAFEWAGGGVLWRAERQTVVRIDRSDSFERAAAPALNRRDLGDPDGRPAVVAPVGPRDSWPIRLSLPASAPVVPVCRDDAGWCMASGIFEPVRASVTPDLLRAVPVGH